MKTTTTTKTKSSDTSDYDLLTATEFAKAIGISVMQVRRWDTPGKYPDKPKPIRRGHHGWRLYSRKQVKDYQKSKEKTRATRSA